MYIFIAKVVSAFGRKPVWMFPIALGVILALIGPFGSYDALNLPLRLMYWIPVMIGAHLFARLSTGLVDQSFGNSSPLVWQGVAVVVFALTYSPSLWAYNALFAGQFNGLGGLINIWANVFFIAVIVGFLVHFLTQEAQANESAARPRLYERLPAESRGEITRLTINDHYVVVFLDDGQSHRLLMRLTDAINEMDNTLGFCTHRSHWVAAAHAQTVTRANRREYLVLTCGAKVPISKTYRANVQAAGLL